VNTYTVTYFPPGWSTTVPLSVVSVVAKEFAFDRDYVLFMDDSTPPQTVFAIPHTLTPMVQQTAPAVSS
jgi:hypothetical protein